MKNIALATLCVAFLAACDAPPSQPMTTTYATLPTAMWREAPIDVTADPESLHDDNMIIVLDGSGSMADSCSTGSVSIDRKMNAAVGGLAAFVGMVPENVNIGLIAFRGSIDTLVPLGRDNRDELLAAFGAVGADFGGGTPLGEATRRAREALEERMFSQLGGGRYRIVIVTDGEAEDSRLLQKEVEHILTSTRIEIHTLGLCIDRGHTLNQPGFVNYVAANTPNEMRSAFQQIAAE